MARETICPACGAPLMIPDNQDSMRCTFCGTELHISEEDGQAHFQVLSQPQPQKEALSRPAEELGNLMGGAQVYPGDMGSVEPPPIPEGRLPETMPAPQGVSRGAAV